MPQVNEFSWIFMFFFSLLTLHSFSHMIHFLWSYKTNKQFFLSNSFYVFNL